MKTKLPYQQTRQWMRAGVGIVVGLFLLMQTSYGQKVADLSKQTILLASIVIEPVKLTNNHHHEKIQPGTPVKVAVTVENKGSLASAAGDLYVRFGFAKPLEQEAQSIIFETEKKPLPTIAPGQSVTIEFTTPHQLPAVFDYVREDWALREYQAIANIDHQEKLLGTLALTFSAYYYPGIRKEFPTPVQTQLESQPFKPLESK